MQLQTMKPWNLIRKINKYIPIHLRQFNAVCPEDRIHKDFDNFGNE